MRRYNIENSICKPTCGCPLRKLPLSQVSPFSVRIIILLLILRSSSLFAAEDAVTAAHAPAADQVGVTVIADTQFGIYSDTRAKDALYGSSMRLDLGIIPLKDIANLRIGFGDVDDILATKGEKIEVRVIVPRRELDYATANLRPLLLQVFSERFATDKVNIILDPLNVDTVINAQRDANAELELAEKGIEALTAEQRQIVAAMKEQNNRIVETLQQWRNSFRDQVKKLRGDYEGRSMLVGSAIGLASSMAPTYLWLTTTGLNPLGLGQIFMTFAYDQINTTFASRLLTFENEHRLPGEKIGLKPLASMIRFYNRNTLLKALAVNFSLSAGTGFSFRLLSWFHNPQEVGNPLSLEFLAQLGGINAISGAATAGSDVGLRQMRKKGYISGYTETVIASSFNFIAQTNNMLLGSGNTEYLPIGLAIEWTTKAAVYLSGKLLPTRTNRFVIVAPGVNGEDLVQVKKMYDLEDSLKREDLHTDRFRDRVTGLDPSPSHFARIKAVAASVQTGLEKARLLWNDAWAFGCQKLSELMPKQK